VGDEQEGESADARARTYSSQTAMSARVVGPMFGPHSFTLGIHRRHHRSPRHAQVVRLLGGSKLMS